MIRTRRLFLVALSFLVTTSSAPRAQEDPHASCVSHPSYVPAELLQREVSLRKGIGNSKETITTKSPDAQAYYNQGLNYLESYVWIEASRSFYQALRHDPACAMAHLGLSYVYSGLENPAAAREELERAKALATKLSDREKARIDIRIKQLAAMEDLKDASLFLAYKKTIDEALAKNLDDPVFWILRGNAEEANASGRGQRGGASSIAFYNAVLALVPDHATAHHYLIHSCEFVGRIDQALEHGEQYALLAPAVPHAAHMWGHDLRRVGRLTEAIAEFKKTDELERAWYAQEKMDPSLDWHHAHNLDLLASCYQHEGQVKLTEKTLRESEKLQVLSSYRAFAQRELPAFLLLRGRYDEALKDARALDDSKYPQGRVVGHALAGQALLALGRGDEAQAELDAAKKELDGVPAIGNGLEPTRTMVEPWVNALQGEILLRAGKTAEGEEILKGVIKGLRGTPGPDAWSQGLFRLELIARTARDAGDWDFADYVAKQMLDHDSAYGGSHYANALVLEHRGDRQGALLEIEAAKKYWKDADTDLPELKAMDELAARSASKKGS